MILTHRNMLKPAVLVILFSSSVLAQNVSPGESKRRMDAKYGFRDVRFEADTASIPGLKRAFAVGPTLFFRRPADNLTVGGAQLQSLLYGFVDGKLSQVSMETKTVLNTTPVRQAFQAEYGEGCTVCRGMGDYYWGSDKERISITVNPVTGDGLIIIRSKSMAKLEDVATKKAAKKAASDL